VIDAQHLKNLGQEFGIDKIRIATANPLTVAAARIKRQIKDGLYLRSEHWFRRNIDTFCDVRSVLPGAKSIIAACQCYLTDEETETGPPGQPYGAIARYTWRNYYSDLRKRLKKIARVLELENNARCLVYSNGEIAEKPIAERCGIGYYGKNSIIINKDLGSWIVLGEIVTDLELEPDNPVTEDCGTCTKCIEACPTGAIIAPYILDRRRCIQALTNWYGVLSDDVANVWGNRLYGCTLCQEVCPANKNVRMLPPRASIGLVGSSVSLPDILEMSEVEYRRKYAHNQMTATWIDFKAIQRNAIVALGNIRDRRTLPLLEKMSRNADEVLARSARWAIANFNRC
jgi:epoxyqueuosine reductase